MLEDAEVAPGERGLSCQARRKSVLQSLVGCLERAPQQSLVRVQVVRPHGRDGRLPGAAAVGQRRERERRVRPGPGEAARRPELAHEQPALGLGDPTALDAREHLPVRGSQHRGLQSRSGGCELDLVSGGDRTPGLSIRLADLALVQQLRQARRARRSLPQVRSRRRRLTEDERSLGISEVHAQVGRERPACVGGRLRRRHRDERSEDRGESRDPPDATA